MSVSVTCPFCRSAFAIAEIPAARRTPCPNCGESVPVSADTGPTSTTAAPPTTVAAPPPRTSGVVFISLGLTAVIVAGFALWFFFAPKQPVSPPPPPSPPATTPPRAMGGLKYIPKDSQVIIAVQPAALDQYAKSKGRSAEELLTEFGLPEDLLKQLRNAGLPPSEIQSLVVAVADVDKLIPRLALVLTLREPLKDEAKFRDKLKAQGRDPAKVDLGGYPLLMAEPNDKTFLFAMDEKILATAKTPTAGYDDLRPAVRESVDKLSVSSIGWVATDDKDWTKLPQLKYFGDKVLADLLNGVRAVALGAALEPDLQLKLSVRVNDSAVARDTADTLQEKLKELKPDVAPSGEWADVSLPLEPTGETLPKLKAALKK